MRQTRNKLILITVFGAQSKIPVITVFVVEDLNELSRKMAIEILLSLTYLREPQNTLGMLLPQW